MPDPIPWPSEAEIAAQRALLCCTVRDWDKVKDVFLTIKPEYFAEGAYREVAEAILSLAARGVPVDQSTVYMEFCQTGRLEAVGGASFIAELVDHVPTTVHAADYAAELVRLIKLRLLSTQLEAAARHLQAPKADHDAVLRDLENLLDRRSDHDAPLAFVDTSAWREDAAKPREDLFTDVMPQGVVCGVSASTGVGKTMLTMSAAIAVVTGRPLEPLRPRSKGRVLALFGEDSWSVIARRLREHVDAYGIPREELDEAFEHRLKVLEAPALPLVRRDRDGNLDTTPAYAWLRRQVEEFKPTLVIVDPLSQWFGGDENDSGQATYFVNRLKALATPSNATVLISHHFSKQGEIRGSTGFAAAFRWHAELRAMTDQDGRMLGVPDHELRRHVRLSIVKFSDGEAGAEWWFRRDQGGVLKLIPLKADRMDAIIRMMAEFIAEHDAHLTEREIEKGDEGAELRAYLQSEVSGVKAIDLREAIARGIRNGLLYKHVLPTGKTRRAEILTKVPF